MLMGLVVVGGKPALVPWLLRRAGAVPGTPAHWDPNYPAINEIPPEMRLALEMAANEDAERRALLGELNTLKEAWREAEEVAAIADHLLDDVS